MAKDRRIVLFSIYVESDDDAEIEGLSDRLEKAICPYDVAHGHPRHCPTPWFLVTHALDDDEADEWRELLNR